jgi:3-methyladenine DNA glycosylase AlkD
MLREEKRMGSAILESIRAELVQLADEKTKSNYDRFFKEKVVFYGVKSGLVISIAKKYYPKIKPLGKTGVFALCEELFKSNYSEEAFIACEWSYRMHNEYETDDFGLFERWLNNYVNDWAKCDTFCNHTIGSFIEIYPKYIENLKKWTRSDNRWLKRAAAVSLIIPAKRGKYLADIFEIADSLLTDKDDLVQKGYGWLLKDASIKHCDEVFDYVMKNKSQMPRTALRYAIERMPNDLKKQAMVKYQ